VTIRRARATRTFKLVLEDWIWYVGLPLLSYLSLDWRNALGLSLRANLASTLIGIPLTGFILLLVEFGTGYAVYLLHLDPDYCRHDPQQRRQSSCASQVRLRWSP
jgi:hypothetical protein